MAKQVVIDYVVMDNNKEIAIICEKYIVEDIDFTDLDVYINQKSVNEKFLLLSNKEKTEMIKFKDIERDKLEKIYKTGFVYILLVENDIVIKTYLVEKPR